MSICDMRCDDGAQRFPHITLQIRWAYRYGPLIHGASSFPSVYFKTASTIHTAHKQLARCALSFRLSTKSSFVSITCVKHSGVQFAFNQNSRFPSKFTPPNFHRVRYKKKHTHTQSFLLFLLILKQRINIHMYYQFHDQYSFGEMKWKRWKCWMWMPSTFKFVNFVILSFISVILRRFVWDKHSNCMMIPGYASRRDE